MVYRYFIIYKPFQVLSQFTAKSSNHKTLKHFFSVPGDVYPVGRLDADSEGLLILTNDPQLNQQLLDPGSGHEREYQVQVEGTISDEAIRSLEEGVLINIDGKLYKTKKCGVEKFTTEPEVWPRTPAIRMRKNIPTSWIRIILSEGKNRQVRKMTAKVGYPTLRLIRYRIQGITIVGLLPGEMMEIKREVVYKKLFNT